jgi:hypothetical protein
VAITHLELLEEWKIPIWSSGYWGYRYAGITGGLMQDMRAEGAATGLAATWLYPFSPRSVDVSYDQPLDALASLGADAGLPLYPGESAYSSLKPRLQNKWAFWTGSPKTGLVSELVAAGYGTAEVRVPGDWSPMPDAQDYWSRFWLIFEDGEHPITGPGETWDPFQNYPVQLGPQGMTAEYHQLLRAIVKRLKPVQWVPWEYYFYLPGGELIRIQGRVNPFDPDYTYYTP